MECEQILFIFQNIPYVLQIELPWLENSASILLRYTEPLESCFDLITSQQ